MSYRPDTLGGGIGIASSANLYYLEALLRGAPPQFQIVYSTINIHVGDRYLIVCGSEDAIGEVNRVALFVINAGFPLNLPVEFRQAWRGLEC